MSLPLYGLITLLLLAYLLLALFSSYITVQLCFRFQRRVPSPFMVTVQLCFRFQRRVPFPLYGIRATLFWPVIVLLCSSVSPSVSTRNFGAQLLCPLLTVVGATLVVK